MALFQSGGLLSLAGSLLGARRDARDLRQRIEADRRARTEDRAIIERTLAEEDRRLEKARRRAVRARRLRLSRAFGGHRAANPFSTANPAVTGFLRAGRGRG